MKKWKDFWQNYRVLEIKEDSDLLYQVAKTVMGKPISTIQYKTIISSIIEGLELNSEDNVCDLCCGNGIITYDIAGMVKKVIGIDSSILFIENAIKYKSKHNIKYVCDDILNVNTYIIGENINKVIFYDSIAYFSENEVGKILNNIKNSSSKKIKIFIGSVLDKNSKFKYFNTFKRKMHYFINYIILRKDLGLGNWISKGELEKLAKTFGYKVKFLNQDSILHTAHYRYDAILQIDSD
jgi:SAM-dependent methyltransferase